MVIDEVKNFFLNLEKIDVIENEKYVEKLTIDKKLVKEFFEQSQEKNILKKKIAKDLFLISEKLFYKLFENFYKVKKNIKVALNGNCIYTNYLKYISSLVKKAKFYYTNGKEENYIYIIKEAN